MMRWLADITAKTKARVEAAQAALPLSELQRQARDLPPVRPLPEAPFLLAEVKRASPSRGVIAREADAAETARRYVRLGADGISCLTEPHYFLARPEDFPAVRQAVDVPLLRKDFVIDPYQVWETRLMGADIVLLIVRLLGGQLERFLAEAEEAGLWALVEVHQEDELALALSAKARFIGVNSRDLDSFEVDLVSAERLLASFQGPLKLAESGIRDASTARRFLRVADGLLIGEEAMRRPALLAEVAAWKAKRDVGQDLRSQG